MQREPYVRSNDVALLIARICLAALFLFGATRKLGNPIGLAPLIAAKGLPFPEVLSALALLAEIGGTVLLLTGFIPRFTAIGLAVFVVMATWIGHSFWTYPPEAQAGQVIHLFKNVAIIGGLVLYLASGPGRFSLSVKRTPLVGARGPNI
ncbi:MULTISPECIES: DoxX family protein [unclassified Bradyrhizobium]|uniref:DoxX family protein n=1 Tax=unclassified Bradyrhizobium TaxID=2631580 RepID=UPI0024794577|nr:MULTISPECIES: DoxX family protein [unclassified Bradyrhizobium]WGR73121.1 DoxX family protein [Bradyrhizobium sp. ISRA426]WGR77961.1 DoxX family protein [Bradyrhizobium sp. ISRA430]WGR88362.1 DoxX family protein [Bradyrhizobium sp. ISRA432]